MDPGLTCIGLSFLLGARRWNVLVAQLEEKTWVGVDGDVSLVWIDLWDVEEVR